MRLIDADELKLILTEEGSIGTDYGIGDLLEDAIDSMDEIKITHDERTKMICERCGKEIQYRDNQTVTCKHITFWEHDTERYLCSKCYEKFQKYMKNHYEKFFTYRISKLKGE